MTLRPGIFSAKIRPPDLPPDALPRPRLLQRLLAHQQRRVLLIAGPAGYGKTTLLRQFIAEAQRPAVWYTLDESDTDPTVFLEYLLAAFTALAGDAQFAPAARAMLGSADAARQPEAVLATLLSAADTGLPEGFILALDDVHRLAGAEVVLRLLDLLVQHAPPGVTIALTSRALPPLPLARLTARQQLFALGTGDLRLQPEEAAALLAQRAIQLEPGEIEALVQRTEGWITGVLLTSHAWWEGLIAQAIAERGEAGPLLDYLAEEVYQHQPPARQRLLLASAVPETLSAAACEALLGPGPWAEELAAIEREGLFLTRLAQADGGPWYRFHQLFRDFLLERLRATEPARHVELRLAAAGFAQARGDWPEAVRHLVAAGQPERAAALLVEVAPEAGQRGRWRSLLDAAAGLPEAGTRWPALGAWLARAAWEVGDLPRALRLAHDALSQMGPSTPVETHVLAFVAYAQALRASGRPQEALSVLGPAEEIAVGNPAAHARVLFTRGICRAVIGNYPAAIDDLRQALALEPSDEALRAALHEALGIALARHGAPAEAEEQYRAALGAWKLAGDSSREADIKNNLAMLRYYSGEFAAAAALLQEALEAALAASLIRSEGYIRASLGEVQLAQGEVSEAVEQLEAALGLARQTGDADLAAMARRTLAAALLRQGQVGKARDLLLRLRENARADGMVQELLRAEVELAMLAVQVSRCPETLAALEEAVATLRQRGPRSDAVRAGCYRAQALFLAGNDDAAALAWRELAAEAAESGMGGILQAEAWRAPGLEQLLAQPAPALGPPPKVGTVASRDGQRPTVEVLPFGVGQVLKDGVPVTRWGSQRARELFFLLVAHPHGLRPEEVVDHLLPEEHDPAAAREVLHASVYRVRHALGQRAVLFERGLYRVGDGITLVDRAAEFEREVAAASRLPPEERIEALQRALALYEGPYLDDLYSDWVIARRHYLATLHVQAVEMLAGLLAERGRHAETLPLYRRLLDEEYAREHVHAAVLQAHLTLGNPHAALEHYRRYAEYARGELGTEPSPELRSLARQAHRLVTGRPAQPAPREPPAELHASSAGR